MAFQPWICNADAARYGFSSASYKWAVRGAGSCLVVSALVLALVSAGPAKCSAPRVGGVRIKKK